MMNKEEFDRQMVFIVAQQARCEVAREKLHEAQRLTAESLREANEMVTRLAYVTHEGFKDVNAKINALVDAQNANEDWRRQAEQTWDAKINALINSQIALQDSQKQTDEQIKQTDEQIKQTDEQLKLTDEQLKRTDEQLKLTDEQIKRTNEQTEEKLRRLTDTVDRYIRNRRNGG